MKYLEDTLAEQCLSKTLYPNTKIIVSRKKVEGTLLTYTNELEVEVDFSDVDPSLLENEEKIEKQPVSTLNESIPTEDLKLEPSEPVSSSPNSKGKSSRFFKKTS